MENIEVKEEATLPEQKAMPEDLKNVLDTINFFITVFNLLSGAFFNSEQAKIVQNVLKALQEMIGKMKEQAAAHPDADTVIGLLPKQGDVAPAEVEA